MMDGMNGTDHDDDLFDVDEPDEPLAEEFSDLAVTSYAETPDAPEQTGPQDDMTPAPPPPGGDRYETVAADPDETGDPDPDPDDVDPGPTDGNAYVQTEGEDA